MFMDPFFEVQRVPAKVINPVNNTEQETGKDVLINSQTGDVLGDVSKNYGLITNSQVNEIFSEAFQNYEILKTNDFLDVGGRRWKRQLVFGNDLTYNIDNDEISLLIEIFNSYTGKNAFGFHLKGFRWMCENGMPMGMSNLFSETYTHFSNILQKIQSSIDTKIKLATDRFPTLQTWMNHPSTSQDLEKFLNNCYKLKDKTKKNLFDEIETTKTKNKYPETLWGYFNSITHLMTHNISTRKKDADPVFSHSYKKYSYLAEEFHNQFNIAA